MIERLFDKDFFVSQEHTIAVEPRAPQPSYPEHTHNFSEIVIVSSGTGKHRLNGHYFDLYPGMVFYVNAHDHHLYEHVNNLHLTNILFRHPSQFRFVSGIHTLLPTADNSETHFFIDQKYQHYLDQILTNLTQQHQITNVNQQQSESLFLQLLITLKQNQYVESASGNIDNRVKQLLRWLNRNYHQPIDWLVLTEQFSLSLRTFYRYLKLKFNLTPQKYLLTLRLAQAHYQLRYTQKSITDIALDCGFSDSNYFATCFKRQFSITPSQHRQSPD